MKVSFSLVNAASILVCCCYPIVVATRLESDENINLRAGAITRNVKRRDLTHPTSCSNTPEIATSLHKKSSKDHVHLHGEAGDNANVSLVDGLVNDSETWHVYQEHDDGPWRIRECACETFSRMIFREEWEVMTFSGWIGKDDGNGIQRFDAPNSLRWTWLRPSSHSWKNLIFVLARFRHQKILCS